METLFIIKIFETVFTLFIVVNIGTIIAWLLLKYIEKAEKTDRDFWGE